MGEIKWRTIPGFSAYEASNMGEIRKGEKLIKQRRYAKGYKQAALRDDDGNVRTVNVARLVLLAFEKITGDTKCTQVDHINLNRGDDRLENLRWVNPHENKKYAVDANPSRYRKKITERPVIMIDEDGTERYFSNIASAARKAREERGSNCMDHTARSQVWYALNGVLKSAYGKKFRYATEQDIINNIQKNS